jgi:hypothetical protein
MGPRIRARADTTVGETGGLFADAGPGDLRRAVRVPGVELVVIDAWTPDHGVVAADLVESSFDGSTVPAIAGVGFARA